MYFEPVTDFFFFSPFIYSELISDDVFDFIDMIVAAARDKAEFDTNGAEDFPSRPGRAPFHISAVELRP
jgi:hypothetical protein